MNHTRSEHVHARHQLTLFEFRLADVATARRAAQSVRQHAILAPLLVLRCPHRGPRESRDFTIMMLTDSFWDQRQHYNTVLFRVLPLKKFGADITSGLQVLEWSVRKRRARRSQRRR